MARKKKTVKQKRAMPIIEEEPLKVPEEALKALRQIQHQEGLLESKKQGIMLGLSSSLGIKPGTGINLTDGVFFDPLMKQKKI